MEILCRIILEYKRRGLSSEDDLTYEERRAEIDKCGSDCDCCFFEKNGGLGAR